MHFLMILLFGISSLTAIFVLKQRKWVRTVDGIAESAFYCVWLVLHMVYGFIKKVSGIYNFALFSLQLITKSGARGTKIPKHLALFISSPAQPADVAGVGRVVL